MELKCLERFETILTGKRNPKRFNDTHKKFQLALNVYLGTTYYEHDSSDSMTVGIVALAGTSLTSSTYGSVSFNLTFFNEFSELNEMIVSIKAKVIDSCIEVIIGRPVITL